jgi:hypothetical protein
VSQGENDRTYCVELRWKYLSRHRVPDGLQRSLGSVSFCLTTILQLNRCHHGDDEEFFSFGSRDESFNSNHNAPNLLLLKRDKGSESETNLSLSHNIYPKFATIIMSFSSSSLLRASLRLSSTAAARCTTPGVAAPRLVCVAGSSRRFQHTLQDSYEYINVEKKDGGVGVITLNRPKALNALCDDLFADLVHAGKGVGRRQRNWMYGLDWKYQGICSRSGYFRNERQDL